MQSINNTLYEQILLIKRWLINNCCLFDQPFSKKLLILTDYLSIRFRNPNLSAKSPKPAIKADIPVQPDFLTLLKPLSFLQVIKANYNSEDAL